MPDDVETLKHLLLACEADLAQARAEASSAAALVAHLRLTIESTQVAERQDGDPGGDQPHGDDKHDDDKSEHKLNTIREMFDALRACWVPPPASQARHGMQMSVRLSFKRTGEIIGTPRITYTTPGTPPEIRDTYYNAIMAALDRCTPLPFTNAMGGAIAGRPIAIRFIDDRLMKAEQP